MVGNMIKLIFSEYLYMGTVRGKLFEDELKEGKCKYISKKTNASVINLSETVERKKAKEAVDWLIHLFEMVECLKPQTVVAKQIEHLTQNNFYSHFTLFTIFGFFEVLFHYEHLKKS